MRYDFISDIHVRLNGWKDKVTVAMEQTSDPMSDYKYQPALTTKLDGSVGESLTRERAYEIVLWKVNRWVDFSDELLSLLDQARTISDLNDPADEAKARLILGQLLRTRGVRLPMASTLLRFINDAVFAVIDKRAFHQAYGGEAILRENVGTKWTDDLVEADAAQYFGYLARLREIGAERGLEFRLLDRILYQEDKKTRRPLKAKPKGT